MCVCKMYKYAKVPLVWKSNMLCALSCIASEEESHPPAQRGYCPGQELPPVTTLIAEFASLVNNSLSAPAVFPLSMVF